MKLIVILAVTIILGVFVAGVTAQTFSQNSQQYNDSQNVGTTSPSPQGCCEWKNPLCCNEGASRGCC
jgi:hypothetical protein